MIEFTSIAWVMTTIGIKHGDILDYIYYDIIYLYSFALS